MEHAMNAEVEVEVWKPHVTVAAVIERDGRFLMVEESSAGEVVLNQPAGHWEAGETLPEACIRETLEECAHVFQPTHLVGIYRWRHPDSAITFLRFAYCGELRGEERGRALDPDILRAVWMTSDELRASSARHRSPLVERCLEDYLAGRRYPLDLVTHVD